ncbi:MAG: hypothetical protein ACJ76H_14900 [Bacteriovoracaceae bacterium]
METQVVIVNKKAYFAGALLMALGTFFVGSAFRNVDSFSYEAYRMLNCYSLFGGLACLSLGMFLFYGSKSVQKK